MTKSTTTPKSTPAAKTGPSAAAVKRAAQQLESELNASAAAIGEVMNRPLDAETKSAPAAKSAPAKSMQFYRNGEPRVGTSNCLSALAWDIGLVDGKRLGVKTFRALLLELGVKSDPNASDWEATIPNGCVASGKLVAELAKPRPKTVSERKSSESKSKTSRSRARVAAITDAADAADDFIAAARETAADRKLAEIAELKAENVAVKAWEAQPESERGERPPTPAHDKRQLEAARIEAQRVAARAERANAEVVPITKAQQTRRGAKSKGDIEQQSDTAAIS